MPLWLVATPIGTLGDLSPRAREILAGAAVIAAEDTRTTRRLLSAVGIEAPALLALHAHNEDELADQLAKRAQSDDVVLVSDAGTPGISDPGEPVVRAAHRHQVKILTVPGPSALVCALSASGFPATPSIFLGFPPRKGREAWVEELLSRPETVVVYEAPGRIADLLTRLAQLAPTREACVCREISKKFEEHRRGPLQQLAATYMDTEVRGECVVVIGPGTPWVAVETPLESGAGVKDVAAALAERWGVPRKSVYQGLLALEQQLRSE